MSFIAVTYGYNQFSIFNTNTSTATFIDKIKETSINCIIDALKKRDTHLIKELSDADSKEESIKKEISNKEKELKTQLDNQAEIKRSMEEIAKREAKEAKKKDNKKTKAPPVEKKKPKKNEDDIENKIIKDIRDTLEKYNTDLQNIAASKNAFTDKRKKLADLLTEYNKLNDNRINIVIELLDTKGDKVNLYNNIESLPKDFLADKTVYELMMETGKNDKNEPILEPFKFDGYCMRSIEQDSEFEALEKTNQKSKPKGNKKK